jgi:hypothetical protein
MAQSPDLNEKRKTSPWNGLLSVRGGKFSQETL